MKNEKTKAKYPHFNLSNGSGDRSPITTTEGNERKFEIKLEFENDSNDIINIQ